MTIKRLTKEELRDRCTEIVYNYLATGDTFCTDQSTIAVSTFEKCPKEYPTPMHMLWKQTQDTIEENAARIKLFEEGIKSNEGNDSIVSIYKEQLKPLLEERDLFLNSNIETQKEYAKRTNIVEYSRSIVKIPLNKLINSYYDDMFLEVLFYDNIGVNAGRFDEYVLIEDVEERKQFIKENIEITHMGLLVAGEEDMTTRAIIGLEGKLKADNSSIGSVLLLSDKYCDFSALTLKDTMEITNNDLRQILQDRIDLDKEGMELLEEKVVGGDNYRILKSPYSEDLYIRYICRSTGRIYYNMLNLTNLRYSEYYIEDNYKSYIDSWWSLNNLGAPIPAEGAVITRC